MEENLNFKGIDFIEEKTIVQNGLKINATDEQKLEEIIHFCEKVETEFNFKIDNSAVSMISIGKMPFWGVRGAFDPEIKFLKLKNVNFYEEIMPIFFHEYCHALDFEYDIYKDFLDLYYEKAEELGIKIIKSCDQEKFAADLSKEERTRILISGNYEMYFISNIREFVAFSMTYKFFGFYDYILNEKIKERADLAWKEFFNLKK